MFKTRAAQRITLDCTAMIEHAQKEPPVMIHIREFREPDAPDVNRIAVAAFSEFADGYTDWPTLRDRIATTSRLAQEMPFFVAVQPDESIHMDRTAEMPALRETSQEKILGAVGYTPPFGPRPDFFAEDAVIIRMLVVDPEQRGLGVGAALTDHCIARAKAEGARRILLHTSEAMRVAQPMYLRRGFQWIGPAPVLFGMNYGLYELSFAPTA